METLTQDGLVIAAVTCKEAEERRPGPAADVQRITDPENLTDELRARLAPLIRPRWLNWVAQAGDSDEDFLRRLGPGERRNVRLGRRFVREEGLRTDVRAGLSEALVDDFLVLYDAQIAAMPRGVDFARRWRDRMLAADADHVGAWVFDGPRLVAGSIWRVRREEGMLQLRFSAVAPRLRAGRVLRALYTEAFRYARGRGLPYLSLGNDPSLFGHVVQPGLFTFKARFGFTPVPAGVLDPRLGGDHADRFLSLRALSRPALVVTRRPGPLPAWPAALAAPACDLVLLTADPAADPDEFRTPALRVGRTVVVPG
ncbi:hypothetical protein [Streptomyces sp. NPDC046727]|uniref:hypothetical protein n=1 Tax=Streptomyces sp. NPDC046727 TaxID=3155373 RepID=UPI0033DE4ACF